jgi:division protein CdvB (Snf7/Vps24/ESCRT-III family)
MMQSMKGATMLLGSMNRQMNLPALQRIAMEFERENDIMDQRQEMMDDAIDDVAGLEDEEEGEEVVNQVLDEIGIDLKDAVCSISKVERVHSANTHVCSSEKRQLKSKRKMLKSGKLRKPLVEVETTMMIYRHA